MQPWFAQMPPSAQDFILATCVRMSARKGEVILGAGEASGGWYALLSGSAKLQARVRNAQTAAFVVLTSGEWFGESAAVAGEPQRHEVLALRDTELICLPREPFRKLLATNVAFANAVLFHMNRRLVQSMAVIEAGRTASIEQRLALCLSPMFWHGVGILELTQRELGELAGISRQSTNKGLKKLQAQGLVAITGGRIKATHPSALQRFARTP